MTTVRRRRRVVVALAMAVAVAGCDHAPRPAKLGPSGTVPASSLPAGSLTVGIVPLYPPLEILRGDGLESEGFDVDLAGALAGALGMTLTLRADLSYAQVVDMLLSRQYDVVISGVVATDRPSFDEIDLVQYLSARPAVLVLRGNPRSVTSLDDVCGEPIGVFIESRVAADAAQSIRQQCPSTHPPPEIVTFGSCEAAGCPETFIGRRYGEGPRLLRTGAIGTVVEDGPVASYLVKTLEGGDALEEATIAVPAAPEPAYYGIAVSKRRPELRTAIVSALTLAIADGTYDTLVDRWGVRPWAIGAPLVNGRPAA